MYASVDDCSRHVFNEKAYPRWRWFLQSFPPILSIVAQRWNKYTILSQTSWSWSARCISSTRFDILASRSDSKRQRMSSSLTGPLTFRTIDRVVSSMNSTRTWVTPPRDPVRPTQMVNPCSFVLRALQPKITNRELLWLWRAWLAVSRYPCFVVVCDRDRETLCIRSSSSCFNRWYEFSDSSREHPKFDQQSQSRLRGASTTNSCAQNPFCATKIGRIWSEMNCIAKVFYSHIRAIAIERHCSGSPVRKSWYSAPRSRSLFVEINRQVLPISWAEDLLSATYQAVQLIKIQPRRW